MSITLRATDVTTTDGTQQTLWSDPGGVAVVSRLVLDLSDAGSGVLLTVRHTMSMDTGPAIIAVTEVLDVDTLTGDGLNGWQSEDMASALGVDWSIEVTAGSNFDLQWEVYST